MSATAQVDRPRPDSGTRGNANVGRLVVEGQDRPGIVSAVSAVLTGQGANILSLDQYSSGASAGFFFQRTVFDLPDFAARRPALESALAAQIGDELGLAFRVHQVCKPKRVAIFASRADHCVLDLLWRHRRGELDIDVVCVISNHPDLADDVRQFSVPYLHVPVGSDKRSAEQEHLKLLRGNVDLVVLARYMQILSEEFLDEVGVPVINIHHSFLPAFIGAAPYKKAKERGVKLVGATAHYVTKDLDEGPIIEQDVVRVTHAETAAELAQHGADVERLVLARAVKWHCEDRVIRHGNQTVVFSR
ncbi:formyltetrahydrofolate deformylase [Amycolatopsis sp. K13G38]|uniref:Formyltetrahydrofolate deformylase n=1 Tax=Amycolatopsis acididurans TaxID=2724524 RepID=A0ABX1IXN1_9PSEU|nr:formyltetrahydrofolate deformylase [Amycolatopsis acididurans]NKQ52263.1 formyltetrahydrofolate deformylase [Amycolatopsis acididurans]